MREEPRFKGPWAAGEMDLTGPLTTRQGPTDYPKFVNFTKSALQLRFRDRTENLVVAVLSVSERKGRKVLSATKGRRPGSDPHTLPIDRESQVIQFRELVKRKK